LISILINGKKVNTVIKIVKVKNGLEVMVFGGREIGLNEK
jgi:hypothetical protein